MHPAEAAPAILPHPALSDLGAVDEVIRGNREMFEVLVRRYNPQLYRVGMAYLRRHEQVEDAMQNAYLKAFLNLSRFDRRASFSTWLTRILINECLMLLRKRKASREEALEAADESALPDTTLPPAEKKLTLKEMKTLLESAIGELPRKYRTVYMLREAQQMTTAEAASCLGVSKESVKVDLHRAREMLKARLLRTAAGVELFPYAAPYCNRLSARVMSAILAV